MLLSPDVTHPLIIKRSLTIEDSLNELWGGKLSFKDSVYSGMFKNLWYYCNKHKDLHEAKPNNLLNGAGCPKCGAEKVQLTKEKRSARCGLEFADKAEAKHPDKYDYTMVWYRRSDKEVMVWCKSHKCFFWVKPDSLLRNKQGCPNCGRESKALKLSAEARLNFPAKAELKHPRKNYYHLVDYKGTHDKVELWCVGCDVSYWINPHHVLDGGGHSWCAGSGFNPNLPSILYYLRVETFNQIAWKIGITNRSVQERFCDSDLENITVIKIWRYATGREAKDRERKILKLYEEYKHTGDPLLKNGNTELFDRDVLGLDLEYRSLP